jgi:hypothetical protein
MVGKANARNREPGEQHHAGTRAGTPTLPNPLGDPFDPAREEARQYGHNHEGALRDGLLLTFVELVVFLAILRPWTPARSLGRAAAALILFVPWSLGSLVLVMHAGGIMTMHAMWMLVLTAVALVCLVGRAVATLRSHRRRL